MLVKLPNPNGMMMTNNQNHFLKLYLVNFIVCHVHMDSQRNLQLTASYDKYVEGRYR